MSASPTLPRPSASRLGRLRSLKQALTPRGAGLHLLVAALVTGLAPAGAARAQLPANPSPISLEAASSDFDRKADRLVFRDVSIRQGDLSIRADLAEATRLDFENSLWAFSGDVRIEFDVATIESQTATLQFEGHQLRHAQIEGAPARFTQKMQPDGAQAMGQAQRLEYDFESGIVTLSENARLTEGANHITGDWLRYDMREERIVAGSDEAGERVQITITPPPQNGGEEDGEPEQ